MVSHRACSMLSLLPRRNAVQARRLTRGAAVFLALTIILLPRPIGAEEPPALNPFGPRSVPADDAQPGRIELSDGKVYRGTIHLTRDARLKIHDQALHRQREIPLRVVRQIDCTVRREWTEREWRFKEMTTDEKMYTGRRYPAREYLHTVTLSDGRKITGPLAALVYLRPVEPNVPAPGGYRSEAEPLRFVLHKRDKGPPGTDLKSLVYVRRIVLDKEAGVMSTSGEKASGN
ncbi:MAG TPA: hypothetical protein VJL29_15410 [Thermoguttaceae bacterium]|nr:hypothetical protein [Thermoguttaceae bacterium]